VPSRNGTGNSAAQCFGKRRYKSYWAAQKASRGLNRFKDGSRTHPYSCLNCHSYHVGTSTGTIKKRRLDRHKKKGKYVNGRIEFSI